MTSGYECVAMLRDEWSILDSLCQTLTEEQWRADTDCLGWTVKDQVSHLVGTERWLLGHAPIDNNTPSADHVKNPLGERNEAEVDHRRTLDPEDVLAEFRAVTHERQRVLDGMSESDFSQSVWTPQGESTMAELLAFRIVDTWVHEQDIRRATGERGHLSGVVPDYVFERLFMGMPKVVGKNAGAPEGAVVTWYISGVVDGDRAIRVEDGRAGIMDATPAEVDVRLVMDLETFVCLSCGRWPPERTIRVGLVEIEGDRELGVRVASSMNILY
jgi:uncharacterized protein (TIGR03083 family)